MNHIENKKQNADINSSMSIITLNMDGLHNSNKRQRLTDWLINKIQLNYVYGRNTLNSKIQTDGK